MSLFRRKPTSRGAEAAPPQHADPWARYEALCQLEPSSLSDRDRLLVAFGALRTEVNNGGFHQFLFNSSGDLAPQALAASTAVELDELTELIQQALDLLGGAYTTDRDRRQEAMHALGNEQQFESLDVAYYALEESVDLDAAMRTLSA